MGVVRGQKNPLHFGFAERLRRARKAASLTKGGLAIAAGLGRNALYGLESGERIPRVDTVELLADALHVSPCWLAFGVELAWSPAHARRCGEIAQRLRQARTARAVSTRALGRDSGTSDTTVRLTETGETIPSIAKVEAIAVALRVSACWLAFGVGDSPLISVDASM